MKKQLFLLVIVLIFVLVAVPTSLAKQNHQKEAPPANNTPLNALPTNQIIIKFEDSVNVHSFLEATERGATLTTLSEAGGISLQYARPMSNDAHVLQLPEAMPETDVAMIANRLAAMEGVLYAEPDRYLQIVGQPVNVPLIPAATTPNDTFFSNQWHYDYVAGSSEGLNLKAAWDITTGSASTVVAVIDTGILSHADLSGKILSGYDFISNSFIANDGGGRDSDPSDPGDWVTINECGYPHAAQNSSWHGTHVAGTIGAATNNSQGVAGVNWNAKILPVRALGKCGGSTSDVVDGMRWAAGLTVSGVPANANPADVLNLSLGGSGSCSTTEQTAINEIVAAGTTVVVAAGNENADASGSSPASCNGIITVAANDRAGNRAYYSNYGSVVEVTAPGGETNISSSNGVLSTLDGGATTPNNDNIYAYYQGTSMATPHVSGVVALLSGENPTWTPAQISQQLQDTARPFPSGSSCNTSICGAGIVDAYNALSTPITEFDAFVYLPVILYSSPPAVNNPFANPGFESGSTSWAEYSSNGWNIILPSSSLPVTPHAGSWAAWLGGDDDDISYVQQQVTVPSSAPYLTYWHWIASDDICGYDFGGVIINGNQVVDVYSLCSTMNTGGWVQHSVNLSAYSGQSVSVKIQVETDSSVNSNLFVDDVSFQASTVAALSPPSTLIDSRTTMSREEILP